MVSIVGYGDGGGSGAAGGYGAAAPTGRDDYGGFGAYSTVAGYGNVAGAKVAPAAEPLVSVDYGYPAPAPATQPAYTSAQGYAQSGGGYDSSYYSQPPAQQ